MTDHTFAGPRDIGAHRADRLLARVDLMRRLIVRPQIDGHGVHLVVDASAIARDRFDVTEWVLELEESGEWTHGPSGVTASLGSSLWAIASSYEFPNPQLSAEPGTPLVSDVSDRSET